MKRFVAMLDRAALSVVSPGRAVARIAHLGSGDWLEPLLLYAVVVAILHMRALARMLPLFPSGPGVVLRRIVEMLYVSGANDFIFVGATALVLFVAAAAKRLPAALSAMHAAIAATYLLIPLALLKVLFALGAAFGADVWWGAHRAINDSSAIIVSGSLSWPRLIIKVLISYGIPVIAGLWALRLLRAPVPEIAAARGARIGGGAAAIAVVVLAMTLLVQVASSFQRLRPLLPGDPLPAAKLALLGDGELRGAIDLQSLRGSVVVVDFWASWCPPCVRSVPELEQLSTELSPRGLRVLGINREPDNVGAASRAWKKLGARFPTAVDQRGLGEAWGLTSLPSSYVFDRDGVLRHVHLGYTPIDEIRAEVETLLGR